MALGYALVRIDIMFLAFFPMIFTFVRVSFVAIGDTFFVHVFVGFVLLPL